MVAAVWGCAWACVVVRVGALMCVWIDAHKRTYAHAQTQTRTDAHLHFPVRLNHADVIGLGKDEYLPR